MDYGHHDSLHAHRVYCLQVVERPPQPPCDDDGKPDDDDGNPYTLVSTYAYDPYGNLTSSTGSVSNPWRFAGGYFDSSTGLYKYGTRYYNPGFGRWSQQDPVRGQLNDPTSLNRYVYASDDPVNFTDPSGRDVMDCIKDMILAAAADLAFLFTLIGVNVQETMAWAALYAALDDATATAATIALAEAGVAAVAAFAWWIIGAVLIIALAALVVMYLSCREYM